MLLSFTSRIGQRLHQIRTEKELSMRAVARMADISVAYLSKIEHDEANPTLEVLERLARVLGLELNELGGPAGDLPLTVDSPDSFQNFVEEYGEKYEELGDPDWRRMLLSVRLHGRYPQKSEDWLMLFLGIRRALS